MSFKREGDDFSLLNVIKKRRVAELLANDVPGDEAVLMANGRYACTVCFHRPVFDTVDMLSIHRKGKKHEANLVRHHRKQKEIATLKLKRAQELHLKQLEGKEKGDKQKEQTVPKLLADTHKITHHALLKAAPYNSCVKRGRAGQTSCDLPGRSDEISRTDGRSFQLQKPIITDQTEHNPENAISNVVPGAYIPKRLQNLPKQTKKLDDKQFIKNTDFVPGLYIPKRLLSKQAGKRQRVGSPTQECDDKQFAINSDNTGVLTNISQDTETGDALSGIPPPQPPAPRSKVLHTTVKHLSYLSSSSLSTSSSSTSSTAAGTNQLKSVASMSSTSSHSSTTASSLPEPSSSFKPCTAAATAAALVTASIRSRHIVQGHEEDMKPNQSTPMYDREKRRADTEYYIKMKSSGWIMDHRSGKWIKDENAEFDSDEEEPPLFPQ